MKLTQYSASGGPISQGTLTYECLEIGEFERATAEAKALAEIFGKAAQNADPNVPLLIVGYDRQKIKQQLRIQRSHPETCLRPIVVAGINERSLDSELMQLADWVLPPQADQDQLLETRSGIELLLQQVTSLPAARDDRVLNLLQFLHSRVSKLQPIVDPDAILAYRYPLAECLLGLADQPLTELLDDLAKHEVLNRQHVDRLFTCPNCDHYRTCVKELCPQCDSTHLSCQESIHHFRCGYVAPESEFMVKGRPQCPKCHGDIQHIGVEYNRPGQFVVCGDCNYWASEPKLMAWCSVCNTYHDPADLKAVNVYAYRLHSNAMRIARQGSWQPAATDGSDPALANGVDAETHLSAAEPYAGPNQEDSQLHTNAPREPAKRRQRGMVKAITQLIQKVAREQNEPTKLYRVEWVSSHIEAAAVKRMLQAFTKDALMCIDIHSEGNALSVILKSQEPSCPTPQDMQQSLSTAFGEPISVVSEESDDSVNASQTKPADPEPAFSAG